MLIPAHVQFTITSHPNLTFTFIINLLVNSIFFLFTHPIIADIITYGSQWVTSRLLCFSLVHSLWFACCFVLSEYHHCWTQAFMYYAFHIDLAPIQEIVKESLILDMSHFTWI
ncbi:hypothetical protein BDR04DRAFT_827811 [Suillus decipiens]|nr:hypothetical protein BDR04DRAFT_827811 [Suillus decipiens]